MAEIAPELYTYCEPLAFPFRDSTSDLSMFYMYTY